MSNEMKYPPLVIQLVGTSETNWVLEGSDKNTPLRMAWPSLMRVIPTSKVREDIPAAEGGGFRFRPIRHIAGCDFIDPVRQDKEGFKPNAEQDNIWIRGGSMTILREGSTIGLYDYMKAYEGNVSNPQRPPDAENVFQEVVAVEVAKAASGGFDKKADAYAILREVRTPDENGGYIYQEDKLGLLSTLFDLNHLDTPEEKFAELYQIADSRPELIVNSIANGKKKLFAQIRKAEELNILSFADDRVYFTDTKTVILAFKGKLAKNTQVNRLADFLLTEDGKPFMQQLLQSIETASTRSLERIS